MKEIGQYWRVLGQYDAETATYSAFAGTAGSSPYTPDESGTLIGLRTVFLGTAATSLNEGVQIKLTCTKFKPNAIECIAVGTGLRTAPATPHPVLDFIVNQPVQAGVPITLEARHLAGTPVTTEMLLLGLFQT